MLSARESARPERQAISQPAEPKSVIVGAVIGRAPEEALEIEAERVLARVNGKTIQLKDLMPLGPEKGSESMTAEEYRSRLERAIDLELTLQACSSRGVALRAEQRKLLGQAARTREAEVEKYKADGISWSSPGSAELGFQEW